jgi:hypothetical protein
MVSEQVPTLNFHNLTDVSPPGTFTNMVIKELVLKQRAAAQKRYKKTAKGRATQTRYYHSKAKSESNKRWYVKNSWKAVVHQLVHRAKIAGRLSKQPCEVCGTKRNVHAHHDDYSQPLKVRWMCNYHHTEHHRNLDRR